MRRLLNVQQDLLRHKFVLRQIDYDESVVGVCYHREYPIPSPRFDLRSKRPSPQRERGCKNFSRSVKFHG